VVDDGSRDNTAGVVQQYSNKHGSDMIRLLKLPQNLGKGGALREVRD
jgi:glycosyltransferase involved in cell wall biosynthesis